jgi:hypothetical protein
MKSLHRGLEQITRHLATFQQRGAGVMLAATNRTGRGGKCRNLAATSFVESGAEVRAELAAGAHGDMLSPTLNAFLFRDEREAVQLGRERGPAMCNVPQHG